MKKISLLIIFTFLFIGCESDEDKILNLEQEKNKLQSKIQILEKRNQALEKTLKKFNIEPIDINNQEQNNQFYKKVFNGS